MKNEVHKTYMAELEIEVLREKNKELKKEINRLKDLLDQHLNIKTTRMDKEQQKEYAVEIAEKVCNYYQIKYGQMMSKYRGEEVTLARQMTMYLTKEKTELNGEEIAQIFNRDRTTVLHSIQKIRGQLSNKFDDTIKKDVFNLNVLI
jgi:chromosomal replication initiation ATPase DnaA